jgi:D-sedoheptulose 7-phosphate isomerase
MLSSVRVATLAERVVARLHARDAPLRDFFAREAAPLARAARAMSERFARGGRLYAFGNGPYATDAAHVSVEFIHPVIVGKRALPAMDASAAADAIVATLTGPDDMAIGFGPPAGDPLVLCALQVAGRRGAFTLAWPGDNADYPDYADNADYAVRSPFEDAHVHQEAFEVLGHTLYESVHVFLEHRGDLHGGDAGAASFLYPYLGPQHEEADSLAGDVAASIVAKGADAERLRGRVANEEAGSIAAAIVAMRERFAVGGRLLLFGNGGSATDATDFALDCVLGDEALPPLPAISLAAEPAVLSAIANDVGSELMFLRQIVAQARPNDIAFALSTSGGSKNVVAALAEARKRGLLTVALLGYDGGEIAARALADHPIVVRSDYIPRIQEAQAAIYHVMREGLTGDA